MMSVFKHTKEEDTGGGKTKLVIKHFSKRRSTMHIYYDEASLKERRDLARGVATVHQMELAHIVTAEGLQVALARATSPIPLPNATQCDPCGSTGNVHACPMRSTGDPC
jgi:hypothetical protein